MMKTNVSDPMFACVAPGRPGWFYTREPREETLRRMVRHDDGSLWIASGPLPMPLEDADLEVLGPVPTRATYEAVQAALYQKPPVPADDRRLAELTAEVMIARELITTMKACLAALCAKEEAR